jgi:hypothetical protein
VDDLYLEHARGITPLTMSMSNFTVPTPPSSPLATVYVEDTSEFTVGDTVTIWGYNNTNITIVISSSGVIESIGTNTLTINNMTAGLAFAAGAMIEKKTNGYYTFTEYPDMGVEWSKTESITKQRTSNNSLKTYNTSGWGERSTKYSVSMGFSDVALTFFNKLKKFEELESRGELLNLHGLTDNVPEIGKDFIQCKMTLSGFKLNHFSRQKCSFSAIFEEV